MNELNVVQKKQIIELIIISNVGQKPLVQDAIAAFKQAKISFTELVAIWSKNGGDREYVMRLVKAKEAI